MALLPRTVYVASCDGCGVTYYAASPEDEDDYELTLPSSELDPAWARQITGTRAGSPAPGTCAPHA
ncbi:hypothetical protein OG883_41230 [Streptomyces sp. NBC_01142]|uniref:hypothetical protein n=1 Tax=Streptomyces sp. NBC_01142 TaxID=2975865 RepID=UPI002255C834|nr:hypothetical protein [Streptomyces sp. NBC_01142]MCX4826095.1 hypothetical protein [Streptomyces sp. NBC_01142]